MTSMGGIKRRQTDKSVRADLRTQIAIGIASRNFNRDALHTRLIAFTVIVNFGAKLVLLSPAQVHTQQHLSPILSINTPTTRVNTQNSVAFIMFSTEHQREL